MAQTSRMKLELLMTVARECGVSGLVELAEALTGSLAGMDRFTVGAWIAERDEFVTQDDFASRYSKALADRMLSAEMCDGLDEFVVELAQRGVPVAVVSLAPADEIRFWLREVGIDEHLFISIRGLESGDKLTSTRSVVSELKFAPSTMVSVGDSPTDGDVAAVVGLVFVRVRSAAGDLFGWEREPSLTVNSLADLIRHWR
ncbi:MAG: HAD hydrolase-like protein [Actinomycetia bacterium]|nr:HAD hydrolase-like protein [Actinomycetes bacterium]